MRGVGEVAAWWAVLTGLWLLTLSTVTAPELVTAAVLAVPCALATRAARRAVGVSGRFRPKWMLWFRHLPGTAAVETAAVLRTRGPGRLEEVDIPDEDAQTVEGRKALATVAIGLSPGTMVADVSSGGLTVHRLLDRPSPVVDEVRR